MTERASLLNGTVDISSEPGSGTRIDVKIPVTRAPQMGPAVVTSEMISA
jgi:chemotaxis protein histidine kinase CheA